jgi:hypothetical protein
MPETSKLEVANKTLPDLVAELRDIRKQKTIFESMEKSVLMDIRLLADPIFDLHDESINCAGKLVLSRVSGTSRTISADKLLERGVRPDIIAYATKVVSYYQYRIKES